MKELSGNGEEETVMVGGDGDGGCCGGEGSGGSE